MPPNDFPWSSPAPGDLRDPGGSSTAERARDIVLWFVNRWAPTYVPDPTTPLGRLLELIAQHARGEGPQEVPDEAAPALWHRMLMLRRIARSIAALHGRAGILRDVHQSFITKELAGTDNRVAAFGMPRGVGTVCLAGRLIQASGGEMTILGEGASGAGHDIVWKPVTGGEVVIERKDRAWDPGATESFESRIRYVIGKVREAGPRLPRRAGVARVLTVGFPGLVTADDEARVRELIDDQLSAALGSTASPETCPDCVVIDTLSGQNTPDGRYIPWTFSHMLDFDFERPEWLGVRDAFGRAFTVRGALAPGPWRIVADYLPE
jgi:hypothetical protein